VNQITGRHDPVTGDMAQDSDSVTNASFSNHPLPSLLLTSRSGSRSRSPISSFNSLPSSSSQSVQIPAPQFQDGVPISPPSTPPTSPRALPIQTSISPTASIINNYEFNPAVSVMVRSSGGRMVDHKSGSGSDSEVVESQSEISAEGGASLVEDGYGKEEDWETYGQVKQNGRKLKGKGKEQCAVDLLSATASRMGTSSTRSSHQASGTHSTASISGAESDKSSNNSAAEEEEGTEHLSDLQEEEQVTQLSHQLLSFSRPISMPDTPAATPESLQYASIGRSSSTSTSSFPSGPQLEVSHRPTFSARAFMVELFPALEDKLFSARGNGKSKKSKNRGLKEGWLAEDAGVELIENCHGWRGAVLDRNGAVMRKAGRGDSEKRVLYVSMPLGSGNKTSGGIEPQSNLNKESTSSNLRTPTTYQSSASLRTTVLSLLDFASDSLHPPCGALVLSIEKGLLANGELPGLLHGLCYVGGNVVSFNGEKEEGSEEGGAGEKPKEGVVLVRIEL